MVATPVTLYRNGALTDARSNRLQLGMSVLVRDGAGEHAHRAPGGVAICAGTDFGGGSPRDNQLASDLQSLVDAGLEPWEGLAAAIWRGGELLGQSDAGVIREGGPAHFSLVHGAPLSDPSAFWRVWKVA
jgi:imidazolonepropionase-like amidohydrolase